MPLTWLLEHSCNAAHVLHSVEEDGKVHGPFAHGVVVHQVVLHSAHEGGDVSELIVGTLGGLL